MFTYDLAMEVVAVRGVCFGDYGDFIEEIFCSIVKRIV
jgi:hypothetical protein